MTVTIYHKPNCSTSRKVLALIREAGVEPTIVHYIDNPPTRKTLVGLLKKLKMSPRELLRRSNTPYDDLGLGDPRWSDDELIDFMLAHPVLIERPIVTSGRKAVVARPPEKVLDILPDAVGRLQDQGGEVGAPEA